MSFGPITPDASRHLTAQLSRILKGAKPATALRTPDQIRSEDQSSHRPGDGHRAVSDGARAGRRGDRVKVSCRDTQPGPGPMRMRGFIAIIAGIAALPLAAHAQQAVPSTAPTASTDISRCAPEFGRVSPAARWAAMEWLGGGSWQQPVSASSDGRIDARPGALVAAEMGVRISWQICRSCPANHCRRPGICGGRRSRGLRS